MNHHISDVQLQTLKQFQDEAVRYHKGLPTAPVAAEAFAARLEAHPHLSLAAQITAGDQQ